MFKNEQKMEQDYYLTIIINLNTTEINKFEDKINFQSYLYNLIKGN